MCHVLPCHIHYTGPANVSEYFTIEGAEGADDSEQVEVTTDEKEDENERFLEINRKEGSETPLSTHFRGRKLQGAEQKLPDTYRGYRFAEGTNFFENSNTVSQLADITQDFDQDGFERNPDDYRDNEPIEMRSWNAIGSFDHLTIWGHERKPDLESDQWACGVRDWHQVAVAMNPIKE